MFRFTIPKKHIPVPVRTRRVRARVDGRRLELLEDLGMPAGEVTVTIEMPDENDVARALDQSAGAWTDDAHPDLATREDVVAYVQKLRAAFDRYAG